MALKRTNRSGFGMKAMAAAARKEFDMKLALAAMAKHEQQAAARRIAAAHRDSRHEAKRRLYARRSGIGVQECARRVRQREAQP